MDCKYWDFTSNQWSSKGCRFVSTESNRDKTVCECNHLTNFAALMDVTGRETNKKTENLLTLIFCTLSIISLISTLTLILFRNQILEAIVETNAEGLIEQRKMINKRIDMIYFNVSVCLLVVNLIVVFGMDRTDQDRTTINVKIILIFTTYNLIENFH